MHQVRAFRRATTALLVFGTAAALLAGCGSDGDTKTASATSTTEASSKGVDASKPTIRIGWTNGDTGAAAAFPFITDGARAAADYVNDELGGIDGQKFELVTCEGTATAESMQKCGQQFANDSSIAGALVGLVQAGSSFYSAMQSAGKPVLGAVPVTPGDYNAPDNTWWYSGGAAATYIGMADLAKKAKAKTVAFLATDNAAGANGAKIFQAALEGSGATVKVVPVPAGATDALPQVVASKAAEADFVGVGITDCLPTFQALRQLNAKGVLAGVGSCVSATNITAHPDVFEGVQLASYGRVTTEPKGSNEDVDEFNANYPKHARMTADPVGPNAEKGWAIVLTLRKVLLGMDAADRTSPTALLTAIKGYEGPLVMGATSFACPGTVAGYPSVCNMHDIYYHVQQGKLTEL
jgi:branched-chain amino acid transport system substrate-binding protein